jgi:rRNA maturation endonuclease Nob1
MSDVVRRCLGCSATYPADGQACPECGSHAADVDQDVRGTEKRTDSESGKPEPARRTRKT